MVKSVINHASPAHTVMQITGKFDRNTAPTLRKDFLKLARDRGAQRIEIDLSGAACTDMSAIAVIVETLGVVHRRGGQLSLSGLDESTVRMISLAQLDQVLQNVIVAETK